MSPMVIGKIPTLSWPLFQSIASRSRGTSVNSLQALNASVSSQNNASQSQSARQINHLPLCISAVASRLNRLTGYAARCRDHRLSTVEIVKNGLDPMACGRLSGVMMALMVAAFSLHCSSSTAAAASSAEEAFVRKTVSSHDIVIFSKSYCPYCRRAKAVFKELDKVPHVVELDQREDGGDIQDALSKIVGRRTVPQVFIKGKHLGGSDDTIEAFESGSLGKLLGIDSKDDL